MCDSRFGAKCIAIIGMLIECGNFEASLAHLLEILLIIPTGFHFMCHMEKISDAVSLTMAAECYVYFSDKVLSAK